MPLPYALLLSLSPNSWPLYFTLPVWPQPEVDGQPIKDFRVFKQKIAGPMGSHVNVTFTTTVEEAVRTESYVGEPSSSLEPPKRVVTVTRELMRGPAPYIRCLSTSCSCTCVHVFLFCFACAACVCERECVHVLRSLLNLDPPHLSECGARFHDYRRRTNHWDHRYKVLLVKVLMGKILLKVFEGKNAGIRFSAVNHFKNPNFTTWCTNLHNKFFFPYTCS